MNDFVIETKNLTKKFGDLTAVSNLDLKVVKGSVFGFLGPNGAGKTTTIKMLLGILSPTEGEARVLGLDTQKKSLEIRKRIGYVPETQAMYDYMKVGEIIKFCQGLYSSWNEKLAQKYLDMFELPLNKKVKDLSKGTRTKLALLLALGPDPDLLILDEPTMGLDPIMRHEFLSTIVQETAEAGRTIFFSSHILSEVERVADWVGIINKGKLVISKPIDEMKLKKKKIRVVFQKEVSADELRLKGVEHVGQEGKGYLLTVDGEVDPILTKLKEYPLTALEVIDLNLEDIFMEYVKKEA